MGETLQHTMCSGTQHRAGSSTFDDFTLPLFSHSDTVVCETPRSRATARRESPLPRTRASTFLAISGVSRLGRGIVLLRLPRFDPSLPLDVIPRVTL
jgi:hypothetical protein